MAVSRNSGYWFVGHTITVQLTAYASVPQHTDSTPWITASGSRPRFGTLAHNGLPFGTVVRLPEVFGNQTFTVEDRMNERYGDEYADVWLPTDAEAHAFRVRRDTPMVIVALPHPEP
ncbi:MAG: 3D domain-containing protein [Candidatus Kerfeldbacteria bacterium]|nr:3D domain-containing protein [Candidatus Kerfeldbacteria bacterium]